MAQWNLSVDLRGQGTSLARTLRTNAGHARNLADAARDAQREITALGTASSSAQSNIRGLGAASGRARGQLAQMARQARDAAGEFRSLASAAALAERRLQGAIRDVRITARLDDDTATGRAALRTALAEIQALSPVRIRLDFDGDPARLAASAAAMRDLRDNADRTDSALNALTSSSASAASALRAATDAARDLSRVLRTLRARALAAASALDELGDQARTAATNLVLLGDGASTANGHLTTLSGNTRTLRGDLDDLDGTLTRVNGNLNGLRGSLGNIGSSANNASVGTKNLILAAVALGSALIPIAAATVPIAAGLGAAGAAVGAFGIAIGGQIMALTEAAEAEEKYDKAVREHGAASAEAAKAEAEYQRLLSEMPPASRESAAALAALKDEYKDWSDALAGDTMPVVTKSLQLFAAGLPHLTPLVKGASRELDHFLNVAAGGMRTEGFDRFMTSFARFATESLAHGTNLLVRFTQALNTGEIGEDLREFLDYARENGPLVGDTLRNLATAATHLLVAMSDMGVSVLTVVNALAGLVNAIPTSLLSTMVQLYAGFKLITLGAAALSAVTGGAAVARLGAYFAIMRAAGVGTTLRATAASMSAMTKASIGLGVLAVAAIGISKLAEKARGAPPDVDRLTTSLKELAESGKFTGELKKTFGDVDGVVKKMNELGDAAKASDEYVDSFGDGSIGPLEDLRRGVHNLWSDFTEGEKSLEALKDDFSGLDEAMAGMVANGYGEQAAKDFALIEAAAKKQGKSAKEVAELFPEYQAALAAAAAEQQLAASGMGLFGQQALATKEKLDAQKASADGLRQSIVALNETNRAALGGMIGFEASIDAAAKAAKENAGSLNMVNGQLDLNSPKAQAAATALQDLGTKTDEAAAAARASGQPWEDVNAIYERGRSTLEKTAQQMGLTKAEAQALAVSILGIPKDHSTHIEMIREDAIAGLDQVIAKIEATPNAKSITVNALTTEAKQLLNSLGYQTKTLPNGKVEVTAYTGGALSGLRAVKSARDSLSDKTITITTHYRITGSGAAQEARRSGSHGTQLAQADGGVVDYYADGGIRGRVQRFAQGGTSPDTKNGHVAHIAKAGTWRVFAEDETGGESYVPLHPSKRTRSRAITEETVRRLGGDPSAIQWNADGGVTDWRYDPQSGSLYSPNDAGAAGNKTKKVKVKGGKTKEVKYFDLAAVEKQLKANSKATTAWNKDLEKVADRVGGDVAEALAAMGKDGVALTHKMATGSTKYINEMAKALRGLAAEAKASLTDYTRELTKATTADSAFAKNLATLAARGYGDLAKQLAAQGDEAAAQLAASAVGDNKKASAANSAAQKANNALTSDQVQDLVAIIAAVKTSKTGLHDVADTTGLGEDDIIDIASKAKAQISSSLGSRAAKFLADLARAQKGLSYADGGIREGIYATRGGAVTFAEPSTGGEAYIPLGANKRRQATNVLRDVASRFGVGLTDMAATRPVYIVREGGDTHVSVTAVRTGASASDIGSQVGRSVRRARRGGVNARAAA
ncbi:hypothetical protein ABZ802_31315 [Streptomyces sp. NPDC047737]|uniref:hypothetical protein n=1 Tax=Streptomyces sp. NPDC047737 TaxID=3155740 RepID=UPI003400158D